MEHIHFSMFRPKTGDSSPKNMFFSGLVHDFLPELRHVLRGHRQVLPYGVQRTGLLQRVMRTAHLRWCRVFASKPSHLASICVHPGPSTLHEN